MGRGIKGKIGLFSSKDSPFFGKLSNRRIAEAIGGTSVLEKYRGWEGMAEKDF